MSFHLTGIGTAIPEHFIEQRDAAAAVCSLCCATPAQEQLVQVIYSRAGVKTRRSVALETSTNSEPARQAFFRNRRETPCGPSTAERMARYEREAAPLAAAAARQALERGNVSPGEITHLVTVSCSGFSAPGFDLSLIHDVGLSPATSRTHLGFMGCHGALNGLRVARAYAEAEPGACVLLCAMELCSLHHQYDARPDQVVANALFGDGAAAVVGRQTAEADWRLVANGSAVLPDSAEMMSWRIGDHGFAMTLSPQVPELLYRNLRPWLEAWLSPHGLNVNAIGSWAIHPGGPKILSACAEALGIELERFSDSLAVLSEMGNMSSPTVLFILQRMQARSAPRPCVSLAFGPGLTIEAALFL